MQIEDLNAPSIHGKYEILYADPPWLYYGSPTKDQAAGKHYPCMSTPDLMELPIKQLRAPKAALFMWATSSKLADACSLFEPWGFYYRSVFQVWVKTNSEGNPIHGQGVRPSFTKPTVEYLLVGSTQRQGRVFPILTEKMPNAVFAPRPQNVHSRKPAEFRQNITDLLGDRLRLELFARETVPGWDCYGNQISRTCEPSNTM